MPREAGHFSERSHSDISSIGALTLTQEQFYTPSSSHDIDPIRTSPDYFSDPATPTPPQTDAASTGYAILRHCNVDAINLMSPSGAVSDSASARANAPFSIDASVEGGDKGQQLASLEAPHTPHRPHAPEVAAPQRQPTLSRVSVPQGFLKRKRVYTGACASVERPSKRQLLVTDEQEALAQRFASPSPPAQLITPSDTTMQRSRTRKRMSPDEPASTDHSAKRLRRVLRPDAHTGTNMNTLEPVEPEPMVSPCTALLDRRLPTRICEHEDAATSARLPITTESLGQRITDSAIHGPEAVSPTDSVPLGSTEQAESDVNERSPLLRKQSSPSQSSITFMLSGSLYGSPSVREDGVECFERGPHAVLAASHLAPYGDDASSEIEDVPFQSSEANVEETVTTSTEHPQISSSDQQGTGGGTDGTCRASDEARPGDSVEEVDHVETNANRAGEAEEIVQSVDGIEEDDRAERNEQAKQPDHMLHAAAG
ncbi:hypothetical protein LTR95_019287, partial [Oleoguttula sp. CCFEE 5521]